jgi:TonB family protein
VRGLLIMMAALVSVVAGRAEQTTPAPATTGALRANAERRGSLDAARELYAAADYQKALDLLDQLVAGNPSRQERESIDLYRILCLIALEKPREADEAMTSLFTRDPLYRPDPEMSPRLRAIFWDKRRLVLSSAIQLHYERGKAAFDRREYKVAADAFSEVLAALSDPDIARQASRPPLSDVRVLAAGFNDLAVRALTPEPSSRPEPTTPASPPAVAAAFRPPTIYDSNSPGVNAPVTLKQDFPRVRGPLLADKTGVLFIVIDESGSVESAIVTESVGQSYDEMLVAASKTWKYRPATLSGVAVKYRKRIQVNLSRTSG